MYIIITFHISSKIPFPSVVILLHRSNGCIMPLWQAQLPPYPLPIIRHTASPPQLQSNCWKIKVTSKNMQNEGFFNPPPRKETVKGNVETCFQFERKVRALFMCSFLFSPEKYLDTRMWWRRCLTLRLHDLLTGTDHVPVNLALKRDSLFVSAQGGMNKWVHKWLGQWLSGEIIELVNEQMFERASKRMAGTLSMCLTE